MPSLLTEPQEHAAVAKIREYELEEARLLQRSLVPAEALRARPVEVVHRFRPVAAVGGDFLDYFLLSDRTVGFYLGDVVGKGLPAALYAALAVGTFRGINKTGEPPGQVLEVLNQRLRMRAVAARYCAVQYAVFNPTTRVFSYANAGLPGPIYISARGCQAFWVGDWPSGLFEDAQYTPHSMRLDPGDAVLAVTDGVTEAHRPGGEEFGMERLLEVCTRNCGAPAALLLDRIFAAVDQFLDGQPQHDDMAAVVLKLGPI